MSTAAINAKKLNVFVPITKVDKEKGIVYGILAAEEEDRSNEVFDYKQSKPYFEKWSQAIAKVTAGKSVGNLRAMHGSVAAGKFTDIHFNDDDKKIEVAAKVVDKNELEKVLEGVYTGFSIGGSYVKRWKEDGLMRYVADPIEGSLVDMPCITSATFEVVKADGSTELRKFHVQAEETEPTNDEIATEAKALAKAAGDETKWLDKVADATEALKAKKKPKAKDDAKPADDAKGADDPEAETDDEASKAAGWAQVWAHPELPGKTFAKKSEVRQALIDKRAADEAAKSAGPVLDAVTKLRESLDDKTSTIALEKLWDRELFPALVADMGKAAGIADADMPLLAAFLGNDPAEFDELAKTSVSIGKDDGKLVKLTDPAKVALLKVLGEAKEDAKPKLSDDEKAALLAKGACLPDGSFSIEKREDIEPALALYDEAVNKATVKRHVTRRARALKAVDLLPEDWGVVVETPVDLKKIAAPALKKAASLYGVSSLISMLAQVDSCEESLESPAYGYGTMIPKALCDRFGAALVELGDIVAAVLDAVLTDMKAEEAAEAGGGVARAMAATELLKFAIDEPLMKAGARHSRIDQGRINDAHDLLVDAGADCEASDYSEKGAEINDLRKTIKAKERTFEKTLGSIMELVTEVADRVKNIEKTPLPMGSSSVSDRFRTVEKGEQPAGGPATAPYSADVDANKTAYAMMTGELQRLSR